MGFTIEIGQAAPDFNLKGMDGDMHSLSKVSGTNGTIVAFTCNHCPYVIGSEDRIKQLNADYSPKGINLICINSNETENYPEDDYEHMIKRANDLEFKFPYLRDETQEIAIAYGAIKTPHFFLLDKNGIVVYTGRMDDNPRNPGQETTHELRDALDQLLNGDLIKNSTTDPIGCTVKWWGRDSHYMPGDVCDLVPHKV